MKTTKLLSQTTPNPRPTLLRSTLFALTLLACSASAQTWQTVDDYQHVAVGGSYDNWVNGMAKDSSGNLYAAGAGGVGGASGFDYTAVVRKSGATPDRTRHST